MTRPFHWAAFCAALIGASCAGPQPAPETAPATEAPKEAVKPASAPPAKPSPSELAARPPAEPKPPPPPQIVPADLIGLTDAELTKVLGAPQFKRVDDPAALWQYRGPRCILDLFLYADGPSYRVTHLEMRTPADGETAGAPLNGGKAARCFTGFLPAAKAKR